MRGCLDAALEQVHSLRAHLQDRDSERTELEQKIQGLKRESQEARAALEESLRDGSRSLCSLELVSRYLLLTSLVCFEKLCFVGCEAAFKDVGL